MGMLFCHAVKVYSPFPLTFLWFFLSITTRVIQQTLILSPTMNQVMEYIGITAIPDKPIMKRWTRDAQDVLHFCPCIFGITSVIRLQEMS